MRRLIFGTLAILVVFLPSLLCQASEKLQIKIWSDKEEYLVREPIFIHYEIKNISDSTIVMAFEEIMQHLKVEGLKGRRHGFVIIDYFYSDSLKPNQSYYDPLKSFVDITSWYGIDDYGSIFHYFPEGNYSLYVKMPEKSPFRGVSSNILKIRVKAPKQEEKKAMQIYMEARKSHKDGKLAFEKYLKLASKYPNSVYAPSSLRAALNYANVVKENKQIIFACEKLIEDYPDSYYMGVAFLYLVENYKVLEEKAGAIEYMKQLMKKYPKTKISERAEYWLRQIEKWEFE